MLRSCLNTSSGNLAGGGSCSYSSSLERQRARMMKWQQDQHQQPSNLLSSSTLVQHQQHSQGSMMTAAATDSCSALDHEVVAHDSTKPPPNPGVGVLGGGGEEELLNLHFEIMPTEAVVSMDVNNNNNNNNNNSAIISRTFSCPPALPHPKLTIGKKHNSSSSSSSSSRKKRKLAENPTQNPKEVVAEKDNNKLLDNKRIKAVTAAGGDEDGESKITGQSNSKDTTSNSKPDYIHVRARRGQATDSHSLAERVRREKISERMKFLQDLVPGCNKITGKAGMLDEIINYVQSLQRQVEFLSMKLATVNPRLDFNINDMFDKEPQVYPTTTTCDANVTFQSIGMSSEMINHHPYLQGFNSTQPVVSYSGLDTMMGMNMNMNMNPSDMGLRRTTSAPVSLPEETFFDHSSNCFNQQIPPSFPTWEGDFQSLYNFNFDQARGNSSFHSQLFTGLVEASNPKMEM